MEPQAEQTNSVVPPPTTTNKHITCDVTATKLAKHPGRVASDKALAERNRIAKEAEKLQQQQQLQQQAILGVGGLLISALGVYYQREAII